VANNGQWSECVVVGVSILDFMLENLARGCLWLLWMFNDTCFFGGVWQGFCGAYRGSWNGNIVELGG